MNRRTLILGTASLTLAGLAAGSTTALVDINEPPNAEPRSMEYLLWQLQQDSLRLDASLNYISSSPSSRVLTIGQIPKMRRGPADILHFLGVEPRRKFSKEGDEYMEVSSMSLIIDGYPDEIIGSVTSKYGVYIAYNLGGRLQILNLIRSGHPLPQLFEASDKDGIVTLRGEAVDRYLKALDEKGRKQDPTKPQVE